MIRKLMTVDDAPFHYRAMVFGGVAAIKTTNLDTDIGRKNIDMALKVLVNARMHIVRKEVLGKRSRLVASNTETGTLKCRFAGCTGN
jgi:chemotaxis receptor (MCP) glutamine deamidase CheD